MFDFSTRMSGEQPVRMVLPQTSPRTEPRVILRRLWRGSGFIVLGGLFMVAAAVALLGLLPPRYTSSIQILVDPSDLRVVENDVNARQPQADSGVSIAESQVRVIQSDNVLRRVIAKLHLDQDDEFVQPDGNNPVVNAVKGALGMLPPAASRDPVNIALDTLQNRLSVRRAERTFVIDVAVQSRDPEKAAQIANAIGDAYFAEEAAARTDTARRASDALAGRLASLKRDVEEAESAVVRYREDHKLVASSGRLLTDQQLGDLNQQLVTASIKTAEAKSRLDQARRMRSSDPSTALPEMLQSLEMQALRQQYATLSRNTAELATRLGERHPAMAEQYAQQRDLQRLIQREKERIIETTQKDYDRAAASEAAIRANLDRVKTETTTSDRAYVGLRELERTLDSRRGVYEAYLKRAREASEQERLNTTNVRVISVATPARQRTFPPSPKIVLPLALVLGLLLGGAIALVLGADRDRRRTRRAATRPAASFWAADA
ncbi:lipopolysaccharide biosynthesis protein [Methylobacterium mesophilicum SR1.6/6]|uniref:Lipopolysaccharide biosynthesis protein n=1 Tax=Methylobacterium mesophilicum SR1.6/6 TaxID=908290 RepID=A0A6B9FJC7_9HYPH|nr:GumC family protein [Methylobacterium mesophilicum]QGY02643.1 lipopolysaccharide biosynthesis protein [Methylobacterium mesophilicum SR1.6/6]